MTEQIAAQPARIVVGVDGSAPSRQALSWAVHYAAMVGASVDAVISWHYPAVSGMGGIVSDWNPELDARKALADAVAAIQGSDTGPTVRQVIRQGLAAQVLLAEAKDAQLLVVGSRGHGGVAGLLLGSVSAHCAEHARCPVLVIH
jgi:nucleotide-binding universal stress UspA family protein